jgi:hypothetical protein
MAKMKTEMRLPQTSFILSSFLLPPQLVFPANPVAHTHNTHKHAHPCLALGGGAGVTHRQSSLRSRLLEIGNRLEHLVMLVPQLLLVLAELADRLLDLSELEWTQKQKVSHGTHTHNI